MHERNLAQELALLATEIDSQAKGLVQAKAELTRERRLREQTEVEAEELRQQLRHARRRAKTAERELAKLAEGADAASHRADVQRRELETRLAEAQELNDVLRHELEQTEIERRAIEQNLRDVLGNLRHAAQEAHQARTVARSTADEATIVPSPKPNNGW
jgi:predicted  nucleic acid-binding Zn-ribbon protein